MNFLDDEDQEGLEKNIKNRIDRRNTVDLGQMSKIPKKNDQKIYKSISRKIKHIESKQRLNYDSEDLSSQNSDSQHEENLEEIREQYKQEAMRKYESLDYDMVRNQPYYSHLNDYHLNYEFYFWLNLFLLGFLVGILGFAMIYTMDKLSEFKDYAFMHYYGDDDMMAVSVYMLISVVYSLIASIPVVLWFPASAGGGIAEIKAYLNGVNYMNLTKLSTGISKLILVTFAVASGMYVGIEGPMIHVGAVVGAVVANMPKLENIFPNRSFYYRFRDDRSKRDFLSCGAACGVVAGFLSPLGGLMFVLEEVSSFWTLRMTLRTFFASMITGLSIFYCVGLRSGNEMLYNNVRFGNFLNTPLASLNELPYIFLLGIICGLVGALWNILSEKLMTFRFYNVMAYKRYRILEILLICILSAGIRVGLPMVMDTCLSYTRTWECPMLQMSLDLSSKSFQQTTMLDYVTHDCKPRDYMTSFNCEGTDYNPVASLFYVGYDQLFKGIWHEINPYGILNMTIFFFSSFVLVLLVNFTAVPMGLFMPSMMVGGALGRLYVEILRTWLGISNPFSLNPGFYALCGSAGLVTGISRLMLTVIVIFYEITNRSDTCLHLMVCTVTAKYVADLFSIGIYDIIIEIRTIPFIELAPHYNYTKKIRAKEIMSKNVICFREVEKVSEIVRVLKEYSHNGFPVLQSMRESGLKSSVFTGTIMRNQLIVLLSKSKFFKYTKEKAVDKNDKMEKIGDKNMNNFDSFGFGDQNLIKNKTYQSLVSTEQSYQDTKDYTKTNEYKARYKYDLLDWNDFCKNYESKCMVIDFDTLGDLDNLWLDLTEYVNKSAMTVHKDCPIERVFELFRALGIRHLTITDNKYEVGGIITRKDIMSEYTHNLL